MSSAEARLTALGITLPPAPRPAANYVTTVRSGRLVFLSGQGPMRGAEVVWRGRVGAELTEAQGCEAARLTILNVLALLREALGSLDAVRQVVKLTVWVRCAEGFQRQHIVANGASDLLVEIFGDRGRHVRSAVSAPELPFGIPVEIEAVVEADEVQR
jgi:enamine deaminase RidA (YjgF/YER057c/UK114 family)